MTFQLRDIREAFNDLLKEEFIRHYEHLIEFSDWYTKTSFTDEELSGLLSKYVQPPVRRKPTIPQLKNTEKRPAKVTGKSSTKKPQTGDAEPAEEILESNPGAGPPKGEITTNSPKRRGKRATPAVPKTRGASSKPEEGTTTESRHSPKRRGRRATPAVPETPENKPASGRRGRPKK